ncbi:AAA family ATPase [Hyphomonas sp.]|uniref:AAA family ATPase n=1 Tax=Hyphomonas sp. TaxID=87 RepID=UPI0032EFCF86
MFFNILEPGKQPPSTGQSEVYLTIDWWNDYSFITMFNVHAFDEQGQLHDLGNVKIGFVDQSTDVSTQASIPKRFEELSDSYFSLGMDVDYYQLLVSEFSPDFLRDYLHALRDVVSDPANLERASGQNVFKTSLLRNVSMSVIGGQFKRVLQGGVPVTDFDFHFVCPQTAQFAGIDMQFTVKASSKPSTNIHAIIGRNGVGKTTILNEMTNAITQPENAAGRFRTKGLFQDDVIRPDYFSSLVSVSFSAFDPFSPPPEQTDPELGPCYFYVGLKHDADESGVLLKSLSDLHQEFLAGFGVCLSDKGKRQRWLDAIRTLESDENFAAMSLTSLADITGEDLRLSALALLQRMSSGHAIVLLTVTKLVEKVEEKTLVLLDEPESHLHPPLLSALMRALSELLFSRNGVAIIATHSPVILQEIPSSCVWKITRSRLVISTVRPEIQTFGENVGTLTREVFGLEVVKSGYHTVLIKAVESGASYEQILSEFNQNLGFEARAILRAMIASRPSTGSVQ